MKKALALVGVLILAAAGLSGQQDEILKLKEKIIELQNKGEPGFRNFTFCSKIFGYASYVPLSKPVIDRNADLLVYYEPLNVFTNKKQGLYEIWFTQDMVLLKDTGEVLQEWKDILTYRNSTKLPVMDIHAQNSLTLGGQLAPGKYKFKAVFKDQLSGKTATHVANFEVR